MVVNANAQVPWAEPDDENMTGGGGDAEAEARAEVTRRFTFV